MTPPLSVKGVLLREGRVLLLANQRNEWDLPGGRPDPGEDHCQALRREVREETGIDVGVGVELGEHLFEVLPRRFVRILAFVIEPTGGIEVTLSQEHPTFRWIKLDELERDLVEGRRLPAGYLGAIRLAQAICAS